VPYSFDLLRTWLNPADGNVRRQAGFAAASAEPGTPSQAASGRYCRNFNALKMTAKCVMARSGTKKAGIRTSGISATGLDVTVC